VKNSSKSHGKQPAKASLKMDKKEKLVFFPALYDCTMEMRVVADKTQVVVTDIDFVACVKLVEEKQNKN
jgi:hypothetical protein